MHLFGELNPSFYVDDQRLSSYWLDWLFNTHTHTQFHTARSTEPALPGRLFDPSFVLV